MTVTVVRFNGIAKHLYTEAHSSFWFPPSGVKIIFRVGLVLLKCMLGTREKLKACQGMYETMELLRAIDQRYMQEAFLVREVKSGDQPLGLLILAAVLICLDSADLFCIKVVLKSFCRSWKSQ